MDITALPLTGIALTVTGLLILTALFTSGGRKTNATPGADLIDPRIPNADQATAAYLNYTGSIPKRELINFQAGYEAGVRDHSAARNTQRGQRYQDGYNLGQAAALRATA